MAKLKDWIKSNYKDVDRLTRAGVLSPTIKVHFEISQHFEASKHIPSKMQRYENTSEAMKVSTKTVREAVKNMKRDI